MSNRQRSITISTETEAIVQDIAEREKRSFSVMAGMLIEQSLKERERQRVKSLKKSTKPSTQ